MTRENNGDIFMYAGIRDEVSEHDEILLTGSGACEPRGGTTQKHLRDPCR